MNVYKCVHAYSFCSYSFIAAVGLAEDSAVVLCKHIGITTYGTCPNRYVDEFVQVES